MPKTSKLPTVRVSSPKVHEKRFAEGADMMKRSNPCLNRYPGSYFCDAAKVFICANGAPIQVATCGGNTPVCQNVNLGTANGLMITSAVCIAGIPAP